MNDSTPITDIENAHAARQVKWKIIGLCIGFLIMFVVSVMLPGRTLPLKEQNALVMAGWAEWRHHNCVVCHSLYGLGGHIGPDLTDVAERRDQSFIGLKIKYGGVGMPAFAAADGPAIMAYLAYIGSSGNYPPRKWPAPGYGARP